VAKLCVEIDAATPLRYCSGEDPVTVGGDLHLPRILIGRSFSLVNPSISKTTLKIDDGDKQIRSAWYADPFSGYPVTITMLLREPSETVWTVGASLTWHCDKASFRANLFELRLRSSYGHRKRYGLEVGNRSTFTKAPEPGETFAFSSGEVTVSSPVDTGWRWWHSLVSNPDEPEAPDTTERKPSGRRSPG
jgi:hypothetical protein